MSCENFYFSECFCRNFLVRFDSIAHLEAHLGARQTSMKEPLANLVNIFLATIFAKSFILDILQAPEYASEYICSNVVKKTFHVKAVIVSGLIIDISEYI